MAFNLDYTWQHLHNLEAYPPQNEEQRLIVALMQGTMEGANIDLVTRRLRREFPDKTIKGPANDPPPRGGGGARLAIAA